MSSRMNAVSDARAEAFLCGGTHRHVSLVVTSRKIYDEEKKKIPARVFDSDTEMNTYHKLRARRRKPCDQRDVVGREFLGRQPVAELL